MPIGPDWSVTNRTQTFLNGNSRVLVSISNEERKEYEWWIWIVTVLYHTMTNTFFVYRCVLLTTGGEIMTGWRATDTLVLYNPDEIQASSCTSIYGWTDWKIRDPFSSTGSKRHPCISTLAKFGYGRAGWRTEQRARTRPRTVGTREHTAWLISKFASADIFYCRGKWAVTDISAENTLGIRKEPIQTHSRLWDTLKTRGRAEDR